MATESTPLQKLLAKHELTLQIRGLGGERVSGQKVGDFLDDADQEHLFTEDQMKILRNQDVFDPLS